VQLDLILRGQSNAILLAEQNHWAASGLLVKEVERLLGFDGVHDSVRLIYDRDGQGGETAYSGTAFLGDWMHRDSAGNWSAGKLENGFLDSIGEYRAEGMGDATALVWMHSEYDSRDPTLAAAEWSSAVRTDAAMVRQALGREVPYLFVAGQPYGEGTDTGHQAIRAGMEHLAADPAFDARIAARAPDIDLAYDNLDGDWQTMEYGGSHITGDDATTIATRIARGVAQEWAAFAKPGSAVSAGNGTLPDLGPQVIQATRVTETLLQVDVRHDASAQFAPLGAAAASGTGWSAVTVPGERIMASGASVLDADSLLVSFAEPLSDGNVLHYAWGVGRVAQAEQPGAGNAILDASGLPVWTPASGVAIGAPATDAVWA
jgi:hypothetical protein